MRVNNSGLAWVLMLAATLGGAVSSMAMADEYLLQQAINDAGRQRMLTQRILKSYAQLGLGIQRQQSEKELLDAVALFEAQYLRLQQWQHESRVAEQLERVGPLWEAYKSRSLNNTNPLEAQQLLGISESLLLELQQLVLVLQSLSDMPAAELINVSGRQRMLTQRMATYYLLSSWGIDTPAISGGMAEVRRQFVAALELLEANSYANAEIVERLARIRSDWVWFDVAIQQSGRERYNLSVLDASDQLLRQVELLTELYVKASTNTPPS